MIDSDYKRTPAELVARYKFEPELNDLYVEGISDKLLFANYIKHRSLNYEVYSISTVKTDIFFDNTPQPTGHRKNTGDKERVESLSAFFEEKIGPRTQCVFCICDRDHDTFFGEKTNNSYLRRTDFAALESYVFEEQALDKVLPNLLRGKAPSGKKAIADLHPVVKFIFINRITRYAINSSLSTVDIDRVISFDKIGNCSFSIDDYLTKLISKNPGFAKEKQSFIEQYNVFDKNSIGLDYRYMMHGHDFSAIINLYLKKLGCEHVTNDFMERILLSSIESEDLDKYPLFVELAQCVR